MHAEPMTLMIAALACIALGVIAFALVRLRDGLDNTVPEVLIVFGTAAGLAALAWLWLRVAAEGMSQ